MAKEGCVCVQFRLVHCRGASRKKQAYLLPREPETIGQNVEAQTWPLHVQHVQHLVCAVVHCQDFAVTQLCLAWNEDLMVTFEMRINDKDAGMSTTHSLAILSAWSFLSLVSAWNHDERIPERCFRRRLHLR
jgi:hypothetical protein